MIYKTIKTALISCFGLFVSLQVVQAQDLMARQANMDRQLRAVDSVSLRRTIQKERSYNPSTLYTSWDNSGFDVYRNQQKPMYFKIDLRGFTMPTPSRQVTSNFGYRKRFRRNHLGLDIKVYTGDTIVSAFDGKVRVVSFDRRGWGYYVVIRHSNGLETLYGHLSKQLVKQDQVVKSGEPIGLGGDTGFSFGSHLHFETRLLGEPINPALMFDFANQDVTGDYYVYRNSRGYSVEQLASENTPAFAQMETAKSEPAVETTQSTPRYHKVKRGETLFSIARSNGLSVDQLRRINGLSKRSKLRAGQVLKTK